MLFQTLDDKSECVGIYAEGELYFSPNDFPAALGTTWKYAPYLEGRDITYASLYLEGRTLTDVIPEYLQDDWGDINHHLSAFRRSLSIAQVNLGENCFYDLVPRRLLIDYCEIKNKITHYVVTHLPRPRRYEFYSQVSALLSDIATHSLPLDRRFLGSFSSHAKWANIAKRMLESPPVIHYNQFGTRTGRLTTKAATFPILTLPQGLRAAILPSKDFLVELDFNGAEVRVLLGMLKREQPSGDVHRFHQQHIFGNTLSRPEAKTAFFAWLYGSARAVQETEAAALSSFYDKDRLLDTYWSGDTITTPYHKNIPSVDRHHALNYLVQSTAAELLLKQALKINHLLKQHGTGSRIIALVHDSLVLDMRERDRHLLTACYELMSSTNFGTFGINKKEGKTLGEMNDIHAT